MQIRKYGFLEGMQIGKNHNKIVIPPFKRKNLSSFKLRFFQLFSDINYQKDLIPFPLPIERYCPDFLYPLIISQSVYPVRKLR